MKRLILGLAVVVAVGVAVAPLASARPRSGTGASPTTISFNAAFGGMYACPGPCATATTFTLKGIAHADSKSLGTMTYTGNGEVLGYDPVSNCLAQSLNFAFTTQNGHYGKDTFYLSTTSDSFCFTDDPNVGLETASFDITGGTGRFADATGSGTFKVTALTHPQKGSGTITATITY